MRPIPEPPEGSRVIINYTGPGTATFAGDGPLTFVCGECSSPLADGVEGGKIRNMVIRCKHCGRYNETVS